MSITVDNPALLQSRLDHGASLLRTAESELDAAIDLVDVNSPLHTLLLSARGQLTGLHRVANAGLKEVGMSVTEDGNPGTGGAKH